jgi:nucleoside-diphosphate-sugar epimerase
MSAKRIAYVTGGMGGIGTAICRRLSQTGYTVIAGCGPGSARKERWLADMRAAGHEVHASEGNVSDWDSTKRAFEVARAEVGPIDILVNNAGITRDGTFQKMTNEAWHAVIETNLNSLFHVTKQVIDGMLERGWGRIVNISSVNGQRGQFGQTNYSTAKAGIHESTGAGPGSGSARRHREYRLPDHIGRTWCVRSNRRLEVVSAIPSNTGRTGGVPPSSWLVGDEARSQPLRTSAQRRPA